MSNPQWEFTQEIELKTLNLLITNLKFCTEFFDIIKPDYFTNQVYQNITKIVYSYFNKYNKLITLEVLVHEINILTKTDSIPKEIYIETIKQIYTSKVTEIEYISDKIIQWCEKTELNLALEKAQELIVTVKPNLNKIRNLVANSSIIESSLGIKNHEDIDKRLLIRSTNIYENKISLGIDGLDRVLRGGISSKELIIFGAAPGIGKSAMLTNITFSGLCQGLNVVYFSSELHEQKVTERVDQRISRMTDIEMRKDRVEAGKRLKRFYSLSRGKIFVKSVGNGEWDTNNIRSYLRKLELKENFKTDLLVIDYLDELKSGLAQDKFYVGEAAITTGLINIGKEFNIPVVTATQATRNAVNKEIVTEKDIAQCFQKVRKADIIVMICQTDKEEPEGIARLYIAKNRSNPEKHIQIPIKIDFSKMYITDLDKD